MLSYLSAFSARAGLARTLCALRRDVVPWLPWALSLLVPLLAQPASAGVGPTVREVVEFTRIVQPTNHDDDELQTLISPDRKRAFIVTRRSDVATDANTFEILLLDIDPEHLTGSEHAAPTSLLKVRSRKDEFDLDQSLREARWHDNRTIVFRARIHDEPFQAYQLDVPTQKLTQLTSAPDGLVVFDVSRDLKQVVYVSPVSNPAVPPGARSVVVGTNSFWNVHSGQLGARFQQRRYQYFVTSARPGEHARALGQSFAESNVSFPSPNISPDGRWALLPEYQPGREVAWAKQYPLIADAVRRYTSAQTEDPLGYFSRKTHYVPRRLMLYRLSDGHAQAVLDVPDDSIQLGQQRSDRLWQNGSASVVIAGTFLPQEATDVKAASASHIIEYWPDSGRWKDVAVLADRLKAAYPVPGRPGTFVAIDGQDHRRFERDADGNWRELTAGSTAASDLHASEAGRPDGGWRLHVQEALNQPPDIVAHGPAGATARLTQLNPQFSAVQWGTMRPYSWKDANGRQWDGGLMVPADFDPTARHALVIQTYGFSPTRFYRDGANIYDATTSGFPGRAFLRENILVLAVPIFPTSGGPAPDSHDRHLTLTEAARGAIDALVDAGWVDRERVGIIGWSAFGERVLSLVTFSDVPIRAATLLDGDSNTLYSLTITYAVMNGVQASKERRNEGLPFGASLQRWVRNDPSMHTDCIRAAMRIETYGPEVHNNWDIYALLRRQYKAAEMVFIPGGAHSLSRPSERMISLQGNVDWYRFWLNGEKRADVVIPAETAASLKEQYVRWDQMKELKQIDDARPSCDVVARSQ